MRVAKKKSMSPTELIDWLNDEGVIDLDWDFPEDGDLIEAGLDSAVVLKLIVGTLVINDFGFVINKMQNGFY